MSALIDTTCKPCRGVGRRLHGSAVHPGPCEDCGGTGVVLVCANATALRAHLETRLAELTPTQQRVAGQTLLGGMAYLNLTRNTSQAAWLNAVDEACEFGAAS